MIRSFKHDGLSSNAGIDPMHAKKLSELLTALNVARRPLDMNVSSWKLHELLPSQAGVWAVTVRANWRITFKFEGSDAVLVDYLDYH